MVNDDAVFDTIIQDCFNQVKDFLIFGAPNKKPMSESSETLARAEFCQLFIEMLRLEKKIDNLQAILLYAIFARLYKYGDCINQASYSFLQLINLNLGKSLRLVKMHGVSEGKAAFHAFVIIGLKAEISSQDIDSYNKDALIFDTWGTCEIVHCDVDLRNKLTTIAEFDQENFSIKDFYRNDMGKFNELEHSLINNFLTGLKNYFMMAAMNDTIQQQIKSPNFFETTPPEKLTNLLLVARMIEVASSAIDFSFDETQEKFSATKIGFLSEKSKQKIIEDFLATTVEIEEFIFANDDESSSLALKMP